MDDPRETLTPAQGRRPAVLVRPLSHGYAASKVARGFNNRLSMVHGLRSRLCERSSGGWV